MECPRCGNTDITVDDTRHFGEGSKYRLRICKSKPAKDVKGCGLVFKAFEEITEVQVFNPNTLNSEYVSYQEYKSKHVRAELEGRSGFQMKMF